MGTKAKLHVGDEVHIPRIDFRGLVESVLPTKDPVVTLKAIGGAKLTMRESKIQKERLL